MKGKIRSARMTMLFACMSLFLFISNAFAQPNNNCASATVLTVGAPCTNGTNAGATTEFGEPVLAGCWASAASNTVWYTFTTGTAGNYTISTDNGGTTDTQLKLYSSACGIYTEIACNEDAGAVNTLAAVISASLAASTQYWIQVDVYNSATGTFCISVAQLFPPSNDCVNNAIDITSLINPVSTSNPFDCNHTYTYNALPSTGDDPTEQVITSPPDPCGCNGVTLPFMTVRTPHYDVWFKFTVSGLTPPAYLQLFPDPATNTAIFVMALYSGNPTSVCPTGNITGLTQIDCSAGEVTDVPPNNAFGASRDEAVCSTPIHPRLDISGLVPGTYYVRVFDFGGFNPPGTGTFALCSESIAPRSNSSDICPPAPNTGYTGPAFNVDVNTTYTGMSNAGAHGNAYAYGGVTGGTNPAICTGAIPNEPSLGATPAGDARDGCIGPWVTYVGTVNNIMNITEVHSFEVKACSGCEPSAIVKLSNIVMDGTPGNVAQLQVMAPGNCTGSSSTIMNAQTVNSCIEMRTAANTPLPNGVYSIVVDGQDGQLISYDLTIIIDYPCPVDTNALGVNCRVVLPVELLSFTGENKNGINKLTWQTASEINNHFYEVQRSTNGYEFTPLSWIDGAGNSSSLRSYIYFDKDVPPGISYYRLKQVDFDGAANFSEIISLKNSMNRDPFLLNPFLSDEDMLTVNYSCETDGTLKVLNIEGSLINEVPLNPSEGITKVQFNLSGLSNGIYFLQLLDGNGKAVQVKFVK